MTKAKIDVSAKAEIIAVMGASGAGKSTYMKRELRRRKPARLLIYDPDEEYLAFGRKVETMADLLSVLKMCGTSRPFRLVFVPHADPEIAKRQFNVLCRAAFEVGNLTLKVDELAGVTTPSWAPPGWKMVSTRGRKRGIVIYGAAQRPANIDKDFLGNASKVRSGRLMYEDDAKAVAKVLGVDKSVFLDMAPLAYIEREPPGKAVRGKMDANGRDRPEKQEEGVQSGPSVTSLAMG